MTATAIHDDDIAESVELLGAILGDWQNMPEEHRKDSMATVPMYPLVKLASMALVTLKEIDPRQYDTLLADHDLTE